MELHCRLQRRLRVTAIVKNGRDGIGQRHRSRQRGYGRDTEGRSSHRQSRSDLTPLTLPRTASAGRPLKRGARRGRQGSQNDEARLWRKVTTFCHFALERRPCRAALFICGAVAMRPCCQLCPDLPLRSAIKMRHSKNLPISAAVGLAQLVKQRFCIPKVPRSIPAPGTISTSSRFSPALRCDPHARWEVHQAAAADGK